MSGCLLSCSLAWADSTPTRPGLFHQWPDWSYSLPLTPWLGRTDLPGFRQRRIKTTFTLLNRVPSGKFNRVNFCYMLRQAHHVLSLSKDTTAAFTLPACRQAGLLNPGLWYVVPIRQAQGTLSGVEGCYLTLRGGLVCRFCSSAHSVALRLPCLQQASFRRSRSAELTSRPRGSALAFG